MGKFSEAIAPSHISFIEKQHLFFVASQESICLNNNSRHSCECLPLLFKSLLIQLYPCKMIIC